MPISVKPTPQASTAEPCVRKQSSLETADQMFKDAFLIKKTRFSHLNPGLSEESLHKMTAAYFRKLNESKNS